VQRIREAMPLTAASYATRFTRRVKTDSGCSWIEYHPRALDKLE
jgi:hypothetical protein